MNKPLQTIITLTLVATLSSTIDPLAHAQAPGAESTLVSMDAEMKTISENMEILKNGVNAQTGAMRPDADRDEFVGAANAVNAAVEKVTKIYKSLDSAQKNAPQGLAAVKAVRTAKLWVLRAGMATPQSFLSQDSVAAFKNFTLQIIPQFNKYKEEIAAGERKLHDFKNLLARQTRAYDRLSPQEKEGPGGKTFAYLLKTEANYVSTTEKAAANSESVRKQAKANCKAFDTSMRERKGSLLHLDALLALYKKQKPQVSGGSGIKALESWLEMIREMKETSDYVQKICTAPGNDTWISQCKPTHGKSRLEGLYASTDPFVWCMATKDFQGAIQTWIDIAAERNNTKSKRIANAAELEAKEGYLSIGFQGRLDSWEETFTRTDAQDEEKSPIYRQIYEAAGMMDMDGSGFNQGKQKALEDLKAEILRLAPRWKRSTLKGNFYGVSLAKKQVKRRFKGAKIYHSGAGGTGWKLSHHKNIHSRSTHRERGGTIMFKVPGDPLCQEHGWIVMEKLNGTKYIKESSVTFGSVRWQECKN